MKHVEYRVAFGRVAEILVWDRVSESNRVRTKIRDFEPYFYVDAHAMIPDDTRIKRVEETDVVGLGGETVKRVVTYLPGQVGEMRKFFPRTWEADVPFKDRYRIDHRNDFLHSKTPRILFLDIETMGSVDTRGYEPITCITVYDSVTRKYYILTWHPKLERRVYYKEENIKVFEFQTEVEMLDTFVRLVMESNPDVFTGWNSTEFDMPYIVNRAQHIGVNTSPLSPIGRVEPKEKDVNISGRSCFDLLPAYKRVHENELDSYKLEEVAQIELGYGKTAKGSDVVWLWENDIPKLQEYNYVDVKILVELEAKLRIFDFFVTLAELANVTLEDTLFNSKMIDMYLLSICHERGICLPTREEVPESDMIEGATVFQPSYGLMHNVAVMDVASLYPTIMDVFNMSPETTEGFMKFKQEPRGLVPTILEDLFALRRKLKAEGLDDQQRAVKELMNSFYGVMLYKKFRLANRDMGASITYVGRELLAWTKSKVEEWGYKPVYGDTDSIFVEGVKTEEEGLELQKRINKSYDDFVRQFGIEKHSFMIEFEAFVDTALFMGVKKKYALKIGDEIKIRGFETRRSNTPRLGRDVQNEVLRMLLTGESREGILKYIKSVRKYIMEEAELDEIASPITLRKSISEYGSKPQHVKAAEYSNMYLGTTFTAGDKILIIFIQRTPFDHPRTNVIASEFGGTIEPGFLIDYKEHEKRCIDNLVDPIFEAVGWANTKNKTLFDF